MAQRRRKERGRDRDGRAGTSSRLCVQTRVELAPGELIRFVAAPTGEITPDISRRLPGRGVWLKCEKDVVAAAVREKTLAKGLKRQVNVPDDLPQKIEALLARRVSEAFALANKAGLVCAGFAQVQSIIDSGTVAALVHAGDGSPSGREKLDRKFKAVASQKGRTATIVTSLSTEELSLAMGRSNVVHAALTQGGATERFLSEAKRLERYRSSTTASGSGSGAQSSEV